MREVSFRFYGQLNDFLSAGRRGHRFIHVLRATTSVKDAIEGLGVPHPEVDVILIDGIAGGFESRLQGGEHVTVYPFFRTLDITGVPRVGTDPPRPVRFALDVHLGKLASLLRLAGFDAVVRTDDAELAESGAREERVVLTRDVDLLKRNVVRHGYWVRHTDPELQLAEVLERFDLMDLMEPFARCLRCNVTLVAADAGEVSDRLLPRTRAEFRHFRRCPACDRIYWQGSHYERLRRLLDRTRERAMTP
jgi:uncharacterized protein